MCRRSSFLQWVEAHQKVRSFERRLFGEQAGSTRDQLELLHNLRAAESSLLNEFLRDVKTDTGEIFDRVYTAFEPVKIGTGWGARPIGRADGSRRYGNE